MSETEIGTLAIGEIHPSAQNAFIWIKDYLLVNSLDVFGLIEAFASTAISGNRTGEVCGETLRRIMHGEPVSDRYILGLAWTLMEMEHLKKQRPPRKKKSENKTTQ